MEIAVFFCNVIDLFCLFSCNRPSCFDIYKLVDASTNCQAAMCVQQCLLERQGLTVSSRPVVFYGNQNRKSQFSMARVSGLNAAMTIMFEFGHVIDKRNMN